MSHSPLINNFTPTSLSKIHSVNENSQLATWVCNKINSLNLKEITVADLTALSKEYLMDTRNWTEEEYEEQAKKGLSTNSKNAFIRELNKCFAYYKNIDCLKSKLVSKTASPVDQLNNLSSVLSKESEKLNLSICDYLNSCGITDYIDNIKAGKLSNAFNTMFNFMYDDNRNKEKTEKNDFYDAFNLYYAWSRFEKSQTEDNQSVFKKLYIEASKLSHEERKSIINDEHYNWKAFKENFNAIGVYNIKLENGYYKFSKNVLNWTKDANGKRLLTPNYDYKCLMYKAFIEESKKSEKNNIFRTMFKNENIEKIRTEIVNEYNNLKKIPTDKKTDEQKQKLIFLTDLFELDDGKIDPKVKTSKVINYCVISQLKKKYPYFFYRSLGYPYRAILEGIFAFTMANALKISPTDFYNLFIKPKNTKNDQLKTNSKFKEKEILKWWKDPKGENYFSSNTVYNLDGVINNTAAGSRADMIHISKISSNPNKYNIQVTEPANYDKAEKFAASEQYAVLRHILNHLPDGLKESDIENLTINSGTMFSNPKELERLQKIFDNSISGNMGMEEYINGKILPYRYTVKNIEDFTESWFLKHCQENKNWKNFKLCHQAQQAAWVKKAKGQPLNKQENEYIKTQLTSSKSNIK